MKKLWVAWLEQEKRRALTNGKQIIGRRTGFDYVLTQARKFFFENFTATSSNKRNCSKEIENMKSSLF